MIYLFIARSPHPSPLPTKGQHQSLAGTFFLELAPYLLITTKQAFVPGHLSRQPLGSGQ